MWPNLRNLALRPLKKSDVAQTLSKLPGFRRNGSFYLGTCNSEVLTGYCIDAPPSSIYIWRFVIPSYDNVEFLHMALGRRIFASSYSELTGARLNQMVDVLSEDWTAFSAVADRRSLISYVEKETTGGHYASWTKLITYVRDGDFGKASELETEFLGDKAYPDTSLVGRSASLLFQAKSKSGWDGAFNLLDAWSKKTVANYCSA